MLPRMNRIRKGKDFARTIRSGTRAGGRNIVVSVAFQQQSENPEGLNPTRVGFITSKAVGNAVTRKTVQRRLRAAVASLFQEDHFPVGDHSSPAQDVVIRALPRSAQVDYHELRSDVAGQWLHAMKKMAQRDRTSMTEMAED
ncbi:ribonuclease P protein component [Auritidibacter sp. NML120779]|nr:ribonuclease P protein component [Auritidibacter sp. NML120779]